MEALYVLGNPIEHSKSPVFQNAALRAAGLEEVYARRKVDDETLPEIAADVRAGRILGCNITLPFKTRAAELVDHRTDAVRATGVANTWWSEDGALWADNTDIVGLQMSFAALLQERMPHRVTILGAGGAAQAAIFAIAPMVEDLTVINRTRSKAIAAVDQVRQYLDPGVRTQALAWPRDAGAATDANAALRRADLVVQTTSIPILFPDDPAPFSALALREIGGGTGGALLELAYGKRPTVPMAQAHGAGVPVLDGATMLLHQGARSFERWIGCRPNVTAMRDALAEALQRSPDEIVAEIPEAIRALWGLAPRDARCGGSA